MRKKINWLLYSIIILFTFSCNNTINEDNDAPNNELTNINSNESLTSQLRQIHSGPSTGARASMFDSQKSNEECFEFIYPISFVLSNESEITINNDEDWDKIDLWYEENNDVEDGPEIEYPFSISMDGSIFEVKNDIDFLELIYLIITFCGDYEEDYEEDCFEFVYPISFVLPGGSEITINNDEDWDKIDLWYEENKDSEEEPEIVYPFDVIVENEIITVESEEDLDHLEEYCFEEYYEEECFEFVYPISFVLPDDSEITINNDEDWDKIDLWYDENKDSEEEPEIVYPFDVIVENETITVESEEDLDRLEEVCD